METFNKMIDALRSGAQTPDTDSNVGDFGHIDSEAGVTSQEDQSSNKLVLYLESGIEIHIPACVFHEMVKTMDVAEGGTPETQVETPFEPKTDEEAEEKDEESGESEESEESESDEDKKECPFEKKDED